MECQEQDDGSVRLEFRGATGRGSWPRNEHFHVAGDFFPVVVDNLPLVGFRREDGHLGLFLYVFDESNRYRLVIEDNELMMRADEWDVEFTGQVLTVRDGPRRIVLEVQFNPPNQLLVQRVALRCNGVTIQVGKGKIHVGALELSVTNQYAKNCHAGIAVGECPSFPSGVIHLRDVNRYR